jgi:RNA polymerase sigma-70 factor, ECF subfamily
VSRLDLTRKRISGVREKRVCDPLIPACRYVGVSGEVPMRAVARSMINKRSSNAPPGDQVYFSDLMARIAADRDRAAFAALFDHFAPRVKAFMMRKGAGSELAEDLVQEAMIAVWTKAGYYSSDRGSVTTWIFTVARNLRIDRIRRESGAKLTELGDYDEPDGSPASDDMLIRLQEDGLVAQALKTLPDEQKQILLMSYVEDIPQSEIALRLHLPLGTVKSRMRLAYRRLRGQLEQLT